MGHTKEPYKVFMTPERLQIESVKTKDVIAVMDCLDWTDSEIVLEMEDTATRIVTCVNACAGLSNDEVKRYGPEVGLLVQLVCKIAHDGWNVDTQQRAQIIASRIEGKEST